MASNRTWTVTHSLPTLFDEGSLTGLTDGQLLERFAVRDDRGSEAAFAALVDRHASLVWRACRSVVGRGHEHDADDAFQATFLILARRAGSLWARDSIAPWLHRVARRAARQVRRQAARRIEAERQAARRFDAATIPEMPDDTAEIIHLEIDRLPERHRVVIILCDLEGRTCEDAARHLRRPVGTVKSRLSRARDRLRAALNRRGVAPASLSLECLAAIDRPTRALAGSTIHGSLLFAAGASAAPGSASLAAATIAKGVLGAMTRARFLAVIFLLLATTSAIIPAWLAQARQQSGPPAGARPPAARKQEPRPAGDLEGNWIVIASDSPFALVRIEIIDRQPRARLVALGYPRLDLARSRLDHFQVDGDVVRFRIETIDRSGDDRRPIDFLFHRPDGAARPQVLRGSWIEETRRAGRGSVNEVHLERTDSTKLNPPDAQKRSPGWKEFLGIHRTSRLEKRREILEGILEKYPRDSVAAYAASALVVNQADAGAPEDEVRALIEQAARISARNGREAEIGLIGLIVDNLVGAERLDDLVLEYARKAVAMLRPNDPVSLQAPTIKYLIAALRKTSRIDEQAALAEIRKLEDRLVALGRPARRSFEPTPIDGKGIPWARSFAAARTSARTADKRMLVAFVTRNSAESRRLNAEVFPRPAVAEAMRPFVSVQVDAEDGEGRPLAKRYQLPLKIGYPLILILDPSIIDGGNDRIVARLPGYIPPGTLADQLTLIARLPRDIGKLRAKAHPDDGEAMRLLVAALAMQGQEKEAAALVERAWGPGADPHFDRWAAVHNTLGIEAALRGNFSAAARCFDSAAAIAKRPIDVYNAHLGAGLMSLLQQNIGPAVRELTAAALVQGISSDEQVFARELLGRLVGPIKGAAAVNEAAALERLRATASEKR